VIKAIQGFERETMVFAGIYPVELRTTEELRLIQWKNSSLDDCLSLVWGTGNFLLWVWIPLWLPKELRTMEIIQDD